jgi:UDP-glucose 4-epimerase
MPASSLVGSLVAQVQRSNIIEVQDPRPIRDYCFVDDIVGALIASCHVVLPESVRTYNLGSGKGLSVADLGKRILKIRWGGGSVRVADVTERPREAEILELVSDSSRAARELGWRAETEIGLGLAAMLRSTEHGGG